MPPDIDFWHAHTRIHINMHTHTHTHAHAHTFVYIQGHRHNIKQIKSVVNTDVAWKSEERDGVDEIPQGWHRYEGHRP